MLNFEPHKPTYKISIEVGRSVVHSENTTHDYSPHAKAFGNYHISLEGGREEGGREGGREPALLQLDIARL